MAVLVAIYSLKTFETHKTFSAQILWHGVCIKDSGGKAAVMSLREVLSLFERGKARDAWVMATS
jgi:hypothetical protein